MERQFSSSEAFKKLRERAEHILKEEKREKVNVEEDDILRLVHELEIHQVELEIQNDELRRTQKDLQASRDEFFDLYESSPVAYVSLNQKDVIERANKAAQRLLKDFQKIGPAREFYLWVHWEDIRIYHAFIERFSMHKEAGPVELRLRGEEGPFYVQMEATACFDNGRKEFRLAFMDISEQKRANKELWESERKMNSIFRAAPIGIGVVINRVIQEVNDRLCKITGYSRDELIGQDTRMVYPSDEEYEYVGTDKYEEMKNGGIAAVDTQLKHKDGKIIDVYLRSVSINPADLSAGIMFTVLDITDRKKTEKALQENEERVRIAVQGGKLGTWDRSFITEKVTWNDYLYEMLGRDPKGPSINVDTFFNYIHPDDREQVLKHLEICLNEGDEFQDVFRVVREDGKVRWMNSVGRVYRDEKGLPLRMAGINNDITEQKQMEEELRISRDELEIRVKERTAELEKRAEQLARLSSELTLAEQKERSRIAKILHDHLQQLLVGAKINQELLIDQIGDMPKELAKRVLDLINQSIKETRNLNAELVPAILNSGDLCASVKSLSRWMKENQDFDVKVDSGAPIILDRPDLAILLFQSIRELLFNVLKHSGVKSASVKMERQNERLHVVVSDQGKGFNPKNIWEQVDHEQRFGLMSIRERLQYLGGHLDVDSGPDEGSAFSMTFPLDREKSSVISEAVDPQSDTPENLGPRLEYMERVSGIIRVMLVDDHPVVREGLSRMFDTFHDIEVLAEASDGQEAVRLAREIVPDVILMDINLPKMDGLEATRIIHTELPHIRIIGLSMYDDSKQAKAMLDAGAKVYLSKSGNTDRLLAAIRGEDQEQLNSSSLI